MIRLKYTINITPGENSDEVKKLEFYGFHRMWDRFTQKFKGLKYEDDYTLEVTISNYDEHRERAELIIDLFKTESIDALIWLITIFGDAGIGIWDVGATEPEINEGLEL